MAETINRTYRYRLYPTRNQTEALDAQLGFACDLYNAALQQRKERRIGLKDQGPQLKEARELAPEGMNQGSQEMILQRLDLAFQAFFRRLKGGEKPGYPRFKAKARFNTLSWRTGKAGTAIKGTRLYVQGVGHIKVKWHRELPGEVRQTRVTRRNGRWHVAFAVRLDAPDPLPKTGEEIGVDLGVRQFVTLSNGEAVIGPRAGQEAAPAIRRAQRKVSRRRKGSNRRRKAVAILARRREREANRRQDAAHKASRALVDRFDLIAVEDLQIASMVRGPRGLAREINDQGWSAFLTHLESKAESAGRQVIRVDPRYTSQRCHDCGIVDRNSRKGPSFTCTACGHADDADVNAAKNILRSARTELSGANRQEGAGSPRSRSAESSPTSAGSQ